jgi:hypothetical protein
MGNLHEDVSTFMTVSRWILLRMRIFQLKLVENIKTDISRAVTLFRKSRRLWDNVEKCGEAREATNDVTVWRIRVTFWISKVTRVYARAHSHALGHLHAHTRSRAHTDKCVINITFPQQQWFANTPHCYVISTLPVLLFLVHCRRIPM